MKNTNTEQKKDNCRKAVLVLHDAIKNGGDAEAALWQAVIAYQDYPFYTSSGLPFSYTVKRKKNAEYSGELIVSRKEKSKTLTRSSVMLAFHTVLKDISVMDTEGSSAKVFSPPMYKGPKAIGQIFGISYMYSLFWKLGLIRVPEKTEDKLKGNMGTEAQAKVRVQVQKEAVSNGENKN